MYFFILNYNHIRIIDLIYDLIFINSTGYARIILAFISIYFMPTNYKIACTCYVVSALLDAFDGHAARAFNQSNITVGI